MNLDVHELAGAYAVDALPDDERRFFERHLDDCGACRGEVGELQATASLLGVAAAEAPPAGMRDRVLAAVAATPQEAPAREQATAERAAPPQRATAAPPQGQPAPPRRDPREWLRQLLPAVAAVIVLGVAGVTVAVTQAGTGQDPGDEQLTEILAAPDSRITDLAAPEGTSARLVWSAERGEGVFLTDGLADAPDGHAYALWVIAADTPALVGMFQPDEQGQASQVIADQLAGAVTVAVTVEPEEGVDAPTTEPFIAGEL